MIRRHPFLATAAASLILFAASFAAMLTIGHVRGLRCTHEHGRCPHYDKWGPRQR